MRRSAFVAKLREYKDTPFHHQGRLKGVGVDCAGLGVCAARELGLTVSDETTYRRIPDAAFFLKKLGENMRPTSLENLLPGDALVFQFDGNMQHVAFVTSNAPLTVIHARMDVGRVAEHAVDEAWLKRLKKAFSFDFEGEK